VTVDLEEWFTVRGHGVRHSDDAWDSFSSSVEAGCERLLSFLEPRGIRATIFALGWVARRRPAWIRSLADRGHELGSHSVSHRRLDSLSPAQLREEISASRKIVEDVTGSPVIGFRAPEWSIRAPSDLALRILAEEGYRFDASMTRVPGLGLRTNPAGPVRLRWTDGSELLEFPPLTGSLFGMPVPAGGSWTGRMFPLPFILAAAESCRIRGQPVVVTLHPWEFDVNHPPDDFPVSLRLMHHAGLARAESRLVDLLDAAGGHFAILGDLAQVR